MSKYKLFKDNVCEHLNITEFKKDDWKKMGSLVDGVYEFENIDMSDDIYFTCYEEEYTTYTPMDIKVGDRPEFFNMCFCQTELINTNGYIISKERMVDDNFIMLGIGTTCLKRFGVWFKTCKNCEKQHRNTNSYNLCNDCMYNRCTNPRCGVKKTNLDAPFCIPCDLHIEREPGKCFDCHKRIKKSELKCDACDREVKICRGRGCKKEIDERYDKCYNCKFNSKCINCDKPCSNKYELCWDCYN